VRGDREVTLDELVAQFLAPRVARLECGELGEQRDEVRVLGVASPTSILGSVIRVAFGPIIGSTAGTVVVSWGLRRLLELR
jgi:hypothetical protein